MGPIPHMRRWSLKFLEHLSPHLLPSLNCLGNEINRSIRPTTSISQVILLSCFLSCMTSFQRGFKDTRRTRLTRRSQIGNQTGKEWKQINQLYLLLWLIFKFDFELPGSQSRKGLWMMHIAQAIHKEGKWFFRKIACPLTVNSEMNFHLGHYKSCVLGSSLCRNFIENVEEDCT